MAISMLVVPLVSALTKNEKETERAEKIFSCLKNTK
jgi:hypothetical protein